MRAWTRPPPAANETPSSARTPGNSLAMESKMSCVATGKSVPADAGVDGRLPERDNAREGCHRINLSNHRDWSQRKSYISGQSDNARSADMNNRLIRPA